MSTYLLSLFRTKHSYESSECPPNIGVIKKSIAEIGDLGDGTRRKNTRLTYTPKAKKDYDGDGQITTADDSYVHPDDNFGFNEGFEAL